MYIFYKKNIDILNNCDKVVAIQIYYIPWEIL